MSSSENAPEVPRSFDDLVKQHRSLPSVADAHLADLPTLSELGHDVFRSKQFDVSDFLLERRHVPLEELSRALLKYLTDLRAELVDVINSEYSEFVSLAVDLRRTYVFERASHIAQPLSTIEKDVIETQTALEEKRHAIENALSRRKDARRRKALLEALVEVDDQVSRVSGLLSEKEESSSLFDAESDIDVSRSNGVPQLLFRVAHEYSHMLYLIERQAPSPFITTLKEKSVTLKHNLVQRLNQTLSDLLPEAAGQSSSLVSESSTRADLKTLLNVYQVIGEVPAAQEIITRSVFRPAVQKLIYSNVLGSPQSPVIPFLNDGSSQAFNIDSIRLPISDDDAVTPSETAQVDALVLLYNKILSVISRDWSSLIQISSEIRSGGESQLEGEPFHLITLLFDELANRVMSRLGFVIFASGRPDVFHRNYTASISFLSRIESICPSLSELEHLRASAAYQTFLRRFQLSVYFQLRYKEVVTSLERSLTENVTSRASSSSDIFLSQQTNVLYQSLASLWDDRVFLQELSSRFWKLSLQLLSRYRTWIKNVTPFLSDRALLAATPSSSNLLSLSSSNPPSQRSSFDSPRDANALHRNATAGSDDTHLRTVALLVHDMTLLRDKATTLFENTILPKIFSEDTESDETDSLRKSMLSALIEGLDQISALVPHMSLYVTHVLTKRASEHLKLARSVASQVRANNTKRTAGPTQPSYFVHNIFKDVRAYFDGPAAVIPEDLRKEWATSVVEEVANRYTSILSSQKKTEDSLRWLKKGRQGLSFFSRSSSNANSADEASTPDDFDPVKVQMLADIEALGEDATQLGVDISACDAFVTLRASVEDSSDK